MIVNDRSFWPATTNYTIQNIAFWAYLLELHEAQVRVSNLRDYNIKNNVVTELVEVRWLYFSHVWVLDLVLKPDHAKIEDFNLKKGKLLTLCN